MSLEYIIWFILAGLWLIVALLAFLTSFNTSYCYIYEREQVKKYNFLINLPITSFERIKFLGFKCAIQIKEKPDWIIILNEDKKAAWVTSKSLGRGCILSDFYKRGSKKLYNKLKQL